jgi:hypothetical protein
MDARRFFQSWIMPLELLIDQTSGGTAMMKI